MNWSQVKRNYEEDIFKAFLASVPGFAGEPIDSWQLAGQDPPDIVCLTGSGRRIGVELGEWLHRGEMSAAKLRETIDKQLLDAIGPQPLNTSQHFDMVTLYPKDRVRLGGKDQGPFRAALLSLISDVDKRWPTERRWHYARGCRIADLSRWPALDKHLESVHFHPGQSHRSAGIDWIVPATPFLLFDDTTMMKPLATLLARKIEKYQRRPMPPSCDEFVLLVFFNQGVAYNTPIQTPRRPIHRVVRDILSCLPQGRQPFGKGYLFLAPTPGSQAIQLW